MMGAGLGVGMNGHRSGPELLGASPRIVDRRPPVHARGLGRVAVERSCRDDPDAVIFPPAFGIVHGSPTPDLLRL